MHEYSPAVLRYVQKPAISIWSAKYISHICIIFQQVKSGRWNCHENLSWIPDCFYPKRTIAIFFSLPSVLYIILTTCTAKFYHWKTMLTVRHGLHGHVTAVSCGMKQYVIHICPHASLHYISIISACGAMLKNSCFGIWLLFVSTDSTLGSFMWLQHRTEDFQIFSKGCVGNMGFWIFKSLFAFLRLVRFPIFP